MLLKRNLLETVTAFSCSGTVICVLLNYVTNISPLKGIWFSVYFVLLFLLSVTLSFRLIQWVINLNKPLKYDLDGLVQNYPYLGFLKDILPRIPTRVEKECKEYDTNELSVISTVLERRLVSSWYVHYVSQEIGFPFACKQMLDQMIGRTFQICNKIETRDVYIDVSSVLITHLKEYRKATKRHEKLPTSPIESLYKMSHPVSIMEKKIETGDHCTNLLRVILKELVPWELWDTPHSELLVRVLSKKLDNFIESTLTDPIWLNDKLMTILKGKQDVTKKEKSEEPIDIIPEEVKNEIKEILTELEVEIPKTDLTPPKLEPTTLESALSTVVMHTTAPILQRAINDDVEDQDIIENVEQVEEATTATEPLDIKSSPVLRQRRGRQGRNEVKIYDRIIEGSVKTWETDTDLQCISLGQDLLASLNGEITLSRLWGQDPQEADTGGKETRFWFGEEDAMDMELESKEPSPVKKEHSPKPTEAILKDIQTTVHQAKTKIGDLQDEAAGMMEGLLDFGIAGLKKGLRFTGLSDDSQEKSPSHKEKEKGPEKSPPPKDKGPERSPPPKDKGPERSPPAKDKGPERSPPPKGTEKSPPPDSKNKPTESKEEIFSTVIQKEENGTSAVPTLVKQQRVASQDSVASLPKPIIKAGPSPLVPLPDSPEPEYEEAADLSTSIAKLRCLLQQRAQDQPSCGAEDVWWESAEETRGRTQQHHSSRPVDTATLADEYDMNADRNTSPGQTSNNMQRLDKLFQRTVTGVFNSIKTAVGAEGEAEEVPRTLHDWTYVCTSIELSVCGAVARLVGSRRAYSHVECALDSLAQLPAPPPRPQLVPEDLEEWMCWRGAAWSAAAELCCAAGLLRAHLALQAATLLLAELAESLISVYLDEVSSWLRAQVFVFFEKMADQPSAGEREVLREFQLEETCAAIVERLPVLQVFGEETVSDAVRLSVSSFSHKGVNRDVVYRVLDILALHFKKSAGLRNPSFDAN
ncbi:uncharacterized protein LOC126375454 isoform X2 [Pectinophora gossypiella]|nr:uncharacterized protein LOC126375454 isoform X2 [Pectinophora gossypiella]